MMRQNLKYSKRIVIKAGTSILTSKDGRIPEGPLERLGAQILNLMKAGKQIVLVSSGAIAFGMESVRLETRPREMPRLQACAAIGQGKLMHAYERFFSKHGLHTAQLLLTRDGLESRSRFLAARKTLEELFSFGALPIVNENDTIATEEIAFGDNDVLSVQVAHLIQADLLILLSDVDGFYLQDGSRVRDVQSEEEIDHELMRHLKDTKKQKTVGGMKAKLAAARIAMRLGVPLAIVNGREKEGITKFLEGEDAGTIFTASRERKNARKKWIAFSAARRGALTVDLGAWEALQSKKRSLLPGGIIHVEGKFERGEVVELKAANGRVFGRGVVNYSWRELEQIAGKKTAEIHAVLGYKHHDEAVHRNDLVIWS